MAAAEQYGQINLKLLLYGDDYLATVVHEDAPYMNSNGVKMKRYLICPSPGLKMAYPELQKPNALPVSVPGIGKCKWVEYPDAWIDDRNPNRAYAICRVICGYDGRGTIQTEKDSKYLTTIASLEQENDVLRIDNISNKEQMKEMALTLKGYIQTHSEINSAMKGNSKETGSEGDDSNGQD